MTEPAMRRPKSPSDGQHVFAYHNTRDTVYKRPPTNLSRPQRKKRRRPRWSTFTSVLYLSSFWFFILITIALLAAAAFGLGEQALRTGGQSAFNIFTIAGAYVLLALISIIHVWSRLVSRKKTLRTMPKPYVPTKNIDVPKKVANHIITEYTRTAVISHISQATTSEQEGWGRPGTRWENQHFRTYILGTLASIRSALAPLATAPPLSTRPLLDAVDSDALRLLLNSYLKIIDRARYGKREPTESDAAACEKVVEIMLLTLELRKK